VLVGYMDGADAGRYDMLCFEGIALNLNIFLQRTTIPKFALKPPADGQLQTITVKEEVSMDLNTRDAFW
jgi:phenylalanyl-tRNA synthetase beta chain